MVMFILQTFVPTYACGGFFCDRVQPVDQSGETIVFETDGDTVTTHVRVQYSGAAQDFSWVLPVPGVPDVFLSSDALFDLLLGVTEPRGDASRVADGDCVPPWGSLYDADVDADSDADTDRDPDTDGLVDVLAETTVGPYETAVIDASDGAALTDWLQTNGYGVPPTFADASAPYLTGDMNFLALKLQKTASLGDLRPLGIRWPGDHPSIPLTLTSIAAVDGMPLNVLILGEARAVPLSYLHVQPNPLVFDYFGHGRVWLADVGLGVDEAGGRAFATMYAGPVGDSWSMPCADTGGLALLVDPVAWLEALPAHGFVGDDDLLAVLRVYLPAPDGVDEAAFYNSPADYPYEWAELALVFDPVAATRALRDAIVTPCTDANAALARNPYLTRLTSTISPSEMTVDPVFGFNPDLGDVAAYHQATVRFDCRTAQARVELEGGYALPIAADELTFEGYPTGAWVARHLLHEALVVEQLGESGPGEVLADYRGDLVPPPLPASAGSGCGCAGAPGASVPLALVAIGVARRARRPHPPSGANGTTRVTSGATPRASGS